MLDYLQCEDTEDCSGVRGASAKKADLLIMLEKVGEFSEGGEADDDDDTTARSLLLLAPYLLSSPCPCPRLDFLDRNARGLDKKQEMMDAKD